MKLCLQAPSKHDEAGHVSIVAKRLQAWDTGQEVEGRKETSPTVPHPSFTSGQKKRGGGGQKQKRREEEKRDPGL